MNSILRKLPLYFGAHTFKVLFIALFLVLPLAPGSLPIFSPIAAHAGNPGGGTTDMPDVLQSEEGAEDRFTNLFRTMRRFSLVLILIGTVLAGVLFVLQKPQWAIAVFAGAIIIGGAPTVIEMLYSALQ